MISIIVCSVAPAKLAATTESYGRALAGEEFEIIGIQDARSICEGYNRGIRRSRGEVLIFSHDDVEVLSLDFKDRLRAHLRNYDLIGVAGTTCLMGPGWINAGPPYIYGQIAHPDARGDGYSISIYSAALPAVGQMQALDGAFLCASRQVVESVPFDEATFQGFHLYDVDFTFRAYLAGFKLAACSDIALIHASGGDYDESWSQDARRFLDKHLSRLTRMRARQRAICAVHAADRNDALELMTPPHWKQLP